VDAPCGRFPSLWAQGANEPREGFCFRKPILKFIKGNAVLGVESRHDDGGERIPVSTERWFVSEIKLLIL
jgi:hypothetical protein